MTEIKLDAKLRTLTRLVVIGFASCFIIALTSLLITLNLRKHYVDSQSEDYAISGYHTMMRELQLEYWKCKYDIVQEMDSYMKTVAENHNISALELLNGCDKYSIDVRLALAQGKVESHFGTQGLASKTNSVWNYKAFDGYKLNEIPKDGKYTHPNLSIEPYLKLIRESYLGDQKTERDLLNKFVNLSGKRYAKITRILHRNAR